MSLTVQALEIVEPPLSINKNSSIILDVNTYLLSAKKKKKATAYLCSGGQISIAFIRGFRLGGRVCIGWSILDFGAFV